MRTASAAATLWTNACGVLVALAVAGCSQSSAPLTGIQSTNDGGGNPATDGANISDAAGADSAHDDAAGQDSRAVQADTQVNQIGSELFGRERRRTHRQCVSRFSRP